MKKWTMGLLLAASILPAQEIEEKRIIIQRKDGAGNVMFNEAVPGPGSRVAGPMIHFMSTEMLGAPVKGAPYSAKAVTETNQALADGNRIRNSTGGMIYRDGEGRTRREQSLGGLGPLAPAEAMEMVFITDPVASVSYVLDPRLKTAHKASLPKGVPSTVTALSTAGGGGMMIRHGAVGVEAAPFPPEAVAGGMTGSRVMIRKRVEGAPADVLTAAPMARREGKTEDLGTQMVEGVQAVGTRYTTTIAAGEIGNERPIEVVFEKWYSPELQVVVMTKNSDPRMGETVYRLTNISRSEPAHSLFEVPPDYTVDEPK